MAKMNRQRVDKGADLLNQPQNTKMIRMCKTLGGGDANVFIQHPQCDLLNLKVFMVADLHLHLAGERQVKWCSVTHKCYGRCGKEETLTHDRER